jgi:hypothetical protein
MDVLRACGARAHGISRGCAPPKVLCFAPAALAPKYHVGTRFLPAAVTREGMDRPGDRNRAVIETTVWYLRRIRELERPYRKPCT